uniref:Uncharacterized protein n=1 Tax=Myoviridae sp. ctbEa13 TaxID=2825136 RepID=A0A8S5VBF9_9CAUD|nr:MAG TPA: hypothetical protein [Myoviridae sp. ctbEa13]
MRDNRPQHGGCGNCPRLLREIPVSDHSELSIGGVVRSLNLRHLTNESRSVRHLIDVGESDVVLHRIRHIDSHEALILLVCNDTTVTTSTEFIKCGSGRDRHLNLTIRLINTEVVINQELPEGGSVECRESGGQIGTDERRNQERIRQDRNIHVAIRQVSLEDTIECGNHFGISQTLETRIRSTIVVVDSELRNVRRIEQTGTTFDTSVRNLLDEQIPTSNNRIGVDLLDGLLKSKLLHLLQFDEPQIVCDFERVNVHFLLVQTSIDTRNVVRTVANHVSELIHDTCPVNSVVGNVINESATNINRDIHSVRYEVLRLIQSGVKLRKSSGEKCKVGIMQSRITNVHSPCLRTNHVQSGHRSSSVLSRNAIDEEILLNRRGSKYAHLLTSLFHENFCEILRSFCSSMVFVETGKHAIRNIGCTSHTRGGKSTGTKNDCHSLVGSDVGYDRSRSKLNCDEALNQQVECFTRLSLNSLSRPLVSQLNVRCNNETGKISDCRHASTLFEVTLRGRELNGIAELNSVCSGKNTTSNIVLVGNGRIAAHKHRNLIFNDQSHYTLPPYLFAQAAAMSRSASSESVVFTGCSIAPKDFLESQVGFLSSSSSVSMISSLSSSIISSSSSVSSSVA